MIASSSSRRSPIQPRLRALLAMAAYQARAACLAAVAAMEACLAEVVACLAAVAARVACLAEAACLAAAACPASRCLPKAVVKVASRLLRPIRAPAPSRWQTPALASSSPPCSPSSVAELPLLAAVAATTRLAVAAALLVEEAGRRQAEAAPLALLVEEVVAVALLAGVAALLEGEAAHRVVGLEATAVLQVETTPPNQKQTMHRQAETTSLLANAAFFFCFLPGLVR